MFEHGLDLLAVDLDWSFVDLHGVPLRFELPHRSLRAARTLRSASQQASNMRWHRTSFAFQQTPNKEQRGLDSVVIGVQYLLW